MNKKESVLLEVYLQPGSSIDSITEYREGVLKVRVSAPPVEGKANDRMVQLLSRALDVPRSSITIIRGHSGRHKIISIDSLSPAQLREKLEIYLQKNE